MAQLRYFKHARRTGVGSHDLHHGLLLLQLHIPSLLSSSTMGRRLQSAYDFSHGLALGNLG